MEFHLLLFPNFKEKALTLSYDDGMRFDIRLVDIMKKNGLKGTFNLNSSLIERDDRVHGAEFKDVYIANGNEVAVHGRRHLSLAGLSGERIIEEVFTDRIALEKELGDTVVTGMAYANGSYDDRAVEQIKACGIIYSRTVISTEKFNINDDWLRWKTTCHHKNPRLMELADAFIKDEGEKRFWSHYNPKLFYLWGHSYEFEYDNNWDLIEKFAEKVGNRDDVWYATNGEIVAYVEAFKALQYSADGSVVYNPSGNDVYIRTINLKKVVVPAGKTVQLN